MPTHLTESDAVERSKVILWGCTKGAESVRLVWKALEDEDGVSVKPFVRWVRARTSSTGQVRIEVICHSRRAREPVFNYLLFSGVKSLPHAVVRLGRTWSERMAKRAGRGRRTQVSVLAEGEGPATVTSNRFAVLAHLPEASDVQQNGASALLGCDDKDLIISCWNVTRLRKHDHDIVEVLEQYRPDILGLCETRLHPNDVGPKHDGYVYQGVNVAEGLGFLISSRVAASAQLVPRRASDPDCCAWLTVSAGKESDIRGLAVCLVYLRTANVANVRQTAAVLDAIRERIGDFRKRNFRVVVMGDFNARLGVGSGRAGDGASPGPRAALQCDNRGKALKSWCRLVGLRCRQGLATTPEPEYTFVRNAEVRSVIDYILVDTRLVSLSSYARVIPNAGLGTEHRPLVMALAGIRSALPGAGTAKGRRWDLRALKGGSSEETKERLAKYNDRVQQAFADARGSSTAAEKLDAFQNALKTAADEAVAAPSPARRGWRRPRWMDKEVRGAMRKRRSAFREFNRARVPGAKATDEAVARWDMFVAERRECGKEVRKAKRRSWERTQNWLMTLESKWPSDFWKALKSITKRSEGTRVVQPVRDGEELVQLTSDPSRFLEIWRSHFDRVSNEPALSGPDAFELERTTVHGWVEQVASFRDAEALPEYPGLVRDWLDIKPVASGLNEPISMDEVRLAIGKLANGKSAGMDEVPGELFKWLSVSNIESLHGVLQGIWESETIPASWQQAVIVPVPKKGDLTEVNNYRGISLLSISSKIFLRILEGRISKAAENGRLAEGQCGFRPERRCMDNIFVLAELTERMRQEKVPGAVCFVDFRKAFDKVWRDGLWLKLHAFGVQGRIWRMLKSLYDRVEGSVRVGGEVSAPFDINIGVRQGCVISPLLFAVFINDLCADLEKAAKGVRVTPQFSQQTLRPAPRILSLLFADDLAIVCENGAEMQKAICALENWCARWGFAVNIDKCGVMPVIARGRIDVRDGETVLTARRDAARTALEASAGCRFLLGGQEVPWVNEYVYLGVTMTDDGSWLPAIKRRAKVLAGAVASFRHLSELRRLPVSLKLRLQKQLLMACALYGCEIWPASTNRRILNDLERQWTDGLRYCIHPRLRMAARASLYAELGVTDLFTKAWDWRCRYYGQVRLLPAERYPHMVFQMERNVQRTWRETVENVLHGQFEIPRTRWNRSTTTADWNDWCAGGLGANWWQHLKGLLTAHTTCRYIAAVRTAPGFLRYLDLSNGGTLFMLRADVYPFAGHTRAQHFTAEASARCRLCDSEPESLEHVLLRCSALEPVRDSLPWVYDCPEGDEIGVSHQGSQITDPAVARLLGQLGRGVCDEELEIGVEEAFRAFLRHRLILVRSLDRVGGNVPVTGVGHAAVLDASDPPIVEMMNPVQR
jgi:hypothetical protein